MKMQKRSILALLAVFGLALVLVAGILVAQQAQAQGVGTQEVQAPQTAVGTAFTYQGHLTKNGQPVNGSCDIVFDIYDAQQNGNYIAYDEVTVSVSDGHFSTQVDPITPHVDDIVFDGRARWLEISVRCPAGSGAYTSLGGRVELTAVPYAHSLRPGAIVKDDVGVPATFSVTNHAENGVAVYGESTSQSTASDWQAYGGKFVSHSRYGVGVYGENTDTGDYGTGYGVYGKVDAECENCYAVYAEGDAHVEGDLTWKAKTSYISVSAAAFRPRMDTYDYTNYGYELISWYSNILSYEAPVQLPHGARVTGVEFDWYDDASTQDGECTLYRYAPGYAPEEMVSLSSEGSSGAGSTVTTTINYDLIDNVNYAYYLEWNLAYTASPMTFINGYRVLIEYTFSEPY